MHGMCNTEEKIKHSFGKQRSVQMYSILTVHVHRKVLFGSFNLNSHAWKDNFQYDMSSE